MRHVVLLLIVVAACAKKDDPPPAPVAKPKIKAKPKREPKPGERCVIDVHIKAGKVTYGTVGMAGEVERPADFAVLRPILKNQCAVAITADDDIYYQEVISIMDNLERHGFIDVTLGDSAVPAPTPNRRDTITLKSVPTADGSIAAEVMPPKPLTGVPVVVFAKKEVTIGGKRIGEVGSAMLGEAIAKALPKVTDDPRVILQADESILYTTIATAVEATQKAGYTDVRYAVQRD